MNSDYLWVLTREQYPDQETLDLAFDIIGSVLPWYDTASESYMQYQDEEWCMFDEMPENPDPQLNPLLDMGM